MGTGARALELLGGWEGGREHFEARATHIYGHPDVSEKHDALLGLLYRQNLSLVPLVQL